MDFLKMKMGLSLALGTYSKSLFHEKITSRNVQRCPKPLTRNLPGWGVFGNPVDFRKQIFRDTESLNKSRGRDWARFSILVLSREKHFGTLKKN